MWLSWNQDPNWTLPLVTAWIQEVEIFLFFCRYIFGLHRYLQILVSTQKYSLASIGRFKYQIKKRVASLAKKKRSCSTEPLMISLFKKALLWESILHCSLQQPQEAALLCKRFHFQRRFFKNILDSTAGRISCKSSCRSDRSDRFHACSLLDL